MEVDHFEASSLVLWASPSFLCVEEKTEDTLW